MALDVESVLQGGVNGQETLGGSGRFETLHLALAPSCRLMRIIGPVVCAQAPVMASRQSNFGLRRAVRAQFVRYQHLGCKALLLEQPAHQFHSCRLVAPSLHEEVENFAFVVDCAAPQARTAGPQSSRPSRRDATAPLVAAIDGEVLWRTVVRTSKPIAAPFRRRCPDRAPRADLRRRDS